MINLYENTILEKYTKTRKAGFLKGFLPLIVVIPVFITFILLVKTKTKILYSVLGSLLLAAYAMLLVYQLLENVVKSKDQIKHFNSVVSKQGQEISGKVISISKSFTKGRNIKVVEVGVLDKEITHKLFLYVDVLSDTLEINQTTKFITVNNFIKEYEVQNEE